MPNRIDMVYAFGGSCFCQHYIRCLAQHYMYVLQIRGLKLIVESGTRCLQLIVFLDIVHMGTHLKILGASYPMNTNTTEFR